MRGYAWTALAAAVWMSGTAAADRPFPPRITTVSLTGDNGFRIAGEEVGGFTGFGEAVAFAGDLDGDGIGDAIVGASDFDFEPSDNLGKAYIVFGRDGLSAPARVGIDELLGPGAVEILGVSEDDQLGERVTALGDFDLDGYDDVAIGARGDFQIGPGRVYVLFGGPELRDARAISLPSLTPDRGFVIPGPDQGIYFGWSLASIGDLNGDGGRELLIGAPVLEVGTAFMIYGGPDVAGDGIFDLDLLDGTNGFAMFGLQSFDYFGDTIAAAGDLNGDGWQDFAVSANHIELGETPNQGVFYVVFGSESLGAGGVFDVALLDGTNGFTVVGTGSDFTPSDLDAAGDVDGDGYDDLMIGNSLGWELGYTSALLFGGPDVGATGEVRLAELDTPEAVRFSGISGSGYTVHGVGDLNADGHPDLAVGCYVTGSDTPAWNSGRTYVAFGGPHWRDVGLFDLDTLDGVGGFYFEGIAGSDYVGVAAGGSGDLNGDGVTDLIVGATEVRNGGLGSAYVLYGQATPEPLRLTVGPLVAGEIATFEASGAEPGATVLFAASFTGFGETNLPQLQVTSALDGLRIFGQAVAGPDGVASVSRALPPGVSGTEVWLQALSFENASRVLVEIAR